MPVTAKFSWTTPTPGGSSGAWGTILNAALDAIDAAMYPTAGKLSECGLLDLTTASAQFGNQIDAVGIFISPGTGPFYVPIPFAKPGVRITGFTSRNQQSGALSGTVSLVYLDATGTKTVVSAGHSLLAGAGGNASTNGLTHDVATGRRYYLQIDVTGASGNISVNALSVAVQASP